MTTKTDNKDKVRTTIYINRDTQCRLKEYAWEQRTSVSDVISQWINSQPLASEKDMHE